LVAATLVSAPACSGSTHCAASASGEPASLTTATVRAPPARKKRVGAIRSGLWPDCEKPHDTRPSQSSCDWYSVTSDIGSDGDEPAEPRHHEVGHVVRGMVGAAARDGQRGARRLGTELLAERGVGGEVGRHQTSHGGGGLARFVKHP